jgi:hypothetical protein
MKEKLLEQRNKRIRPLLDKIIWDGMPDNTTTSKALPQRVKKKFRKLATDNMQFLLSAFADSGQNEFYHTWK